MNTTINFIETLASQQPMVLCRWVEHCYLRGDRVQIMAESTLAAQHLDQLLWTFSDLSFIPHRIQPAGTTSAPPEPVVIAVGAHRLEGFDTLVFDVSPELDSVTCYRQVLHFVVMDDPQKRQASRVLYQQARDAGIGLRHFPQTSNLPRRSSV